jgi:hypothetical protein
MYEFLEGCQGTWLPDLSPLALANVTLPITADCLKIISSEPFLMIPDGLGLWYNLS